MISKYSDQKEKIKEEEIEEAAREIVKGNLVLFPTETVYGIGANALDEEAVKKIFIAKGRAQDNPLIVHVSNMQMVEDIVESIGDLERKLIQRFWPGPLTIIFQRKSKEVIPNIVTANLDTVGVRMPSNGIAKELIEKAGVPIAAPSANVSGKPSGTKVEDIITELDGKVEYILDGGFTDIGLESTVIKVEDNKINILRPGKVTKEQLEEVAREVKVDKHVLGRVEQNEVVSSPGMKYRHYAPNTKCMMIYSENEEKMINEINKVTNQMKQEDKKVLVIGRKEHLNSYLAERKWNVGETLEEVAKNIFTLLRKVDKEQVDLIIIEGVGEKELGLAITNRLIRACAYNYLVI
ncbi:MAG: threonylcarbamoyl-AMP synthase [Clostridia bacterium]|nr:threonylcarbamoyl-AMP synthase [Clostridia bacterium]